MTEWNYEITQATPREFLEVAALDRMAWPEEPDVFIPDGEHAWRLWCEHAVVLIAKLSGRMVSDSEHVIGALLMFPTIQGETFLHKIMVHPDARGQGIGSALMKAGLARATTKTLLTVNPQNTAAVKLYQNFGFEIRELVKGYYRPHEDRYVMRYTPKNVMAD
jgi:[ribosomal protein S18]-alanine N-acetyltransferase